MSKKTEKTKIQFEYDGEEYTLEYTADSLKKMERGGFDFSNIDKKALTAPEELFVGAFIANHGNTPRKKRLEIYEELCGEDESGETVMGALSSMMAEAIDEILNRKGNIKWQIVR